ncbi:VOC family protein [Roseateles asaccharophilus]|uniref:Catechol 2,3-dioxygenase-like lactoylglutathione lyase family enzyme n=1 Tax=Roseateles asaccharophilus TaxID=582607 RepID=A0ABU2AF95_9BURK|nr:VOC family protein [Roseateles asaccharophilus]MDR7335278.1 catechol 2,3-dioxygenase-like lactoylglutathione lyase family enzyme [Roseateles asaccharophilus]
MLFAYTLVFVADVAASLDFFDQAFGLPRRFLHESGAYGEVDTGEGGVKLAFVDHATARDSVQGDYVAADTSAKPLGMEIGFTVLDVQAAFDRAVAAGARPVAAPVSKPWGQVVSYVRCPDGTLVELCTAMG